MEANLFSEFFACSYLIFFNARLESISSYAQKSIWASKSILHDGRNKFQVKMLPACVPGSGDHKIQSSGNIANVMVVADIIDRDSRQWKEEFIRNTFCVTDVARFFMMIIWCGKARLQVSTLFVVLKKCCYNYRVILISYKTRLNTCIYTRNYGG